MYHVDLELSAEQVKQLHQIALDRGQTVRGLVTQLAIKEIQENEKQKEETEN